RRRGSTSPSTWAIPSSTAPSTASSRLALLGLARSLPKRPSSAFTEGTSQSTKLRVHSRKFARKAHIGVLLRVYMWAWSMESKESVVTGTRRTRWLEAP
ncbi:Os01g0974100, partial [Oryza sativa Japonica Group]